MRTDHDAVLDDLDALVAGEPAAISRHADHLAGCDTCRDLRHDATRLAARLAAAGADHVPAAGLVDALMARLDATAGVDAREGVRPAAGADQPPATTPSAPAGAAPAARAEAPRDASAERTPREPAPRTSERATAGPRRARTRLVAAAGAMAALAAGAVGVVALERAGGRSSSAPPARAGTEPIGTVETIARAAAEPADGLAIRSGDDWRPVRHGEAIPAGAALRTDERTRAALALRDGSRIVLDHRTEVVFDAAEPRRQRLIAGRLVADVAHVPNRPGQIVTPGGTIDVLGTRLSVTATDALTAVQVERGTVALGDGKGKREEIRAGEEGLLDHGVLTVGATAALARDSAWSELAPSATGGDEATAGLGALRAYKPGEQRDRDWKLSLASHEVKVRISGPVARTEITETFRNDSDATLEGVYQFPLPPDAQIDSLRLDTPGVPGTFIEGAFVDKERAARIWRGVIDKATPKRVSRDPLLQQEIVWVPGPWKDPALLDWKRGGRFELRIYPIPARGARTIKIAYTQVVTPRGTTRQYVYPLPHSSDGSTVAETMKLDLEVRGARSGSVRAAGYPLTADPARVEVNGMTLEQGGFVPRGDLVIDYRPDGNAELRAWTFAGGAAVGPDETLAARKNVGIDPKVVDAQRAIAADARPTAVLALAPRLPRWREGTPRDYVIVVDGSQSMVGERFARSRELAVALVRDMDRRDRVGVLVCDSECRRSGDLSAPSAAAAGQLATWLAAQTPAGASDLVAAIRAGVAELTDAQREKWVLFVGDGFASTGFRRIADVERALAASTRTADVHVTTIGVGSDVDAALLAAAARGGGGSYLAWSPGQTVRTAAMAALESTYGASLRDATVELPAGLVEVAAAGGAPGATTTTTSLPTLRAGGEVLIAARLAGEVTGDVVLRGKVAGQPFEQRYPLSLSVSSSPGNGFVPRLWASLAIDQLERAGAGADRPRVVAMSQAFGVMSRQTSLLVLESQAMFDAFGVDRGQPAARWTGEEDLDEVETSGALEVPGALGNLSSGFGPKAEAAKAKKAEAEEMYEAPRSAPFSAGRTDQEATLSDSSESRRWPRALPVVRPQPRTMIAMRRVWTRHAALAGYAGVSPTIARAITSADDALAASPDSRERHRALVQALSFAGELGRARDAASRWRERDQLDPQALGYLADLLGRDGQRELGLRTLAGLVDLDADRASLHERLIGAYERGGRLAQACSHRVALVGLAARQAAGRAGAAARCLRALGRADDAALVLGSLGDDAARAEAEKAATVSPATPRVDGDLVIAGAWTDAADLDISLIAPDGTRVSWMGGRADVTVADATSQRGERLAVKRLKKGNYLIEVSRGDAPSGTVRGTLEVRALGQTRSLPFELTGARVVVGQLGVTLQSHLEPVPETSIDDWRWVNGRWVIRRNR